MVKTAKELHEKRVTEGIKRDKRNKKVWDCIKMLKGDEQSKKDVVLYGVDGKRKRMLKMS